MRDQVSTDRAAYLHPAIRNEVIATISAVEAARLPFNIKVRIVQGLRTFAEQQALYEQGRTKPGAKVTNSKAGQSYHNYGLAIDFALIIDGKISWKIDKYWMEVVNAFKAAGYTWGGDFRSIKDNPHVEKTFGLKWWEMRVKHDQKDFIEGTEFINLVS